MLCASQQFAKPLIKLGKMLKSKREESSSELMWFLSSTGTCTLSPVNTGASIYPSLEGEMVSEGREIAEI
ncbi:hypothetical protein BT69DRAFT_1280483 [Atractiella rhizophila]|nr:hypothetical protein BT69DRAFT_1280483 [Atractiella rhizophila]